MSTHCSPHVYARCGARRNFLAARPVTVLCRVFRSDQRHHAGASNLQPSQSPEKPCLAFSHAEAEDSGPPVCRVIMSKSKIAYACPCVGHVVCVSTKALRQDLYLPLATSHFQRSLLQGCVFNFLLRFTWRPAQLLIINIPQLEIPPKSVTPARDDPHTVQT